MHRLFRDAARSVYNMRESVSLMKRLLKGLFIDPFLFAVSIGRNYTEYNSHEKRQEAFRKGIALGRRIERWEIEHGPETPSDS